MADPVRRAAALSSCQTFLDTYFRERFPLPWSDDHREIIATGDKVVTTGSKHAECAPRGSGKTTIAESLVIYAICSGKRSFVPFFHSKHALALQSLQSIKRAFETNALLIADFPEICYPIQKLEGIANRCAGQLYRGEHTNIIWKKDFLVTPAIPGYPTSECVIAVCGVNAGIRGMKHTRTNGTVIRPDFCVVDDIQKDRQSPQRVNDLIRLVDSAICGLAGPDVSLAVLFLGTVRSADDVCSHYLDRTKSPQWAGRKYKLLYAFPDRMDLWEAYSIRRSDELRNGGSGALATASYLNNRAAMDAGAKVAWPARLQGKSSAIQFAMDLYFEERDTFFSEYQNEPLEDYLGDGQLEASVVAARINGLARAVVPLACSKVTAFIDVQQKVLFWTICAWSEDFTGSIIDYGSWPPQNRRYFTAADVQQTFARKFPGAGLEAQIHAALGVCADEMLGRTFAREDGASFRIERLLIDAGFQGETVKTWCRTTHHAALVIPSHGHAIGASGKPWSEYDRTRCEKLGLHWMIPKLAPGKKAMRHVTIDVNFWKSFVAARLKQAIGEKGALTIWGKAGQDHGMLSDHLTSEYWIGTEGRGRLVQEWRMRPGQTENHWWDGAVGSACAASMQGAAIIQGVPDVAKKRVSFAELQRKQMERAGARPADEKKPEPAESVKTKGKVSFAEIQRRRMQG